jgi:hypothetical protein
LAGIWFLTKVIAVDISFNTETQECIVLIYDFGCLVFSVFETADLPFAEFENFYVL